MLLAVSVRNIVLMDSLDIASEPGLCALTGETGAGKSILLDALGLATGARADRGLLRHGTDEGSVTAEFALQESHPAWPLLEEAGMGGESELILRRVVGKDGRSRAFINDQPVSVGLLQRIGGTLIEIHGQHDDRGLLNPAGHRTLLDAFGGLGPQLAEVGESFSRLAEAREALTACREGLASALADSEFLTHALKELDDLNAQEGEEEALASERSLMMNSEKIVDDLQEALSALTGDGGMEGRLAAALRRLEKAASAGGRLEAVLASLERALVEAGEARAGVEGALADLDFEPGRLEEVEERLFALRALARKHNVTVDGLIALREDMSRRLGDLQTGEDRIKELEAAEKAARADYLAKAEALTKARGEAAKRLDKQVMIELEPLKLEKARFRTALEILPEDKMGPEGRDRARFEVATNPGAPFGGLKQIASGGELSRFILALKVALAAQGSAGTLIFDEVDRGVGGAVADAVGERLLRLAAGGAQVLVVTHSPQVAARAQHHLHISKAQKSGAMATVMDRLDADGRLEEIARMLAGAEVTSEARAAASRLLNAAPMAKPQKAQSRQARSA